MKNLSGFSGAKFLRSRKISEAKVLCANIMLLWKEPRVENCAKDMVTHLILPHPLIKYCLKNAETSFIISFIKAEGNCFLIFLS